MQTLSDNIQEKNARLISDIKKGWGENFGKLSKSEQLWILAYLTGVIIADKNDNYNPHDVKDSLVPDCEQLNDTSYKDKLDLAKSLIDDLVIQENIKSI